MSLVSGNDSETRAECYRPVRESYSEFNRAWDRSLLIRLIRDRCFLILIALLLLRCDELIGLIALQRFQTRI